jgi:ribosomal protein S18 acetylase RimI-like enzyme
MPRGSERQPDEADLLHFVAVHGERVIGCVAFRGHTEVSGQLLQMAVDDNVQGRGLGRRLVRYLEHHVRERGFREVTLHARDIAVGFYEKLGYRTEGDTYVEVSIPHRNMRRQVDQ